MKTATRFAVLASLFALEAAPTTARAASIQTNQIVLAAATAFENGQGARGVKLDPSGAAVLYDRVLVEDDGPGIGSDAWWMKTDRAPITEITDTTWIKKILHVERPAASAAWLYAPENTAIELNGQPLPTLLSNAFTQAPAVLLKPGDNQVVLRARGGKPTHVKIALPEDILRNAPDRKDRTVRSFKSEDAGKTWQPITGEFMVRLHLVQYVPQGNFISPVVDLTSTDGAPTPLSSAAAIESVSLAAEADTPSGTHIDLELRTGPSPVFEPSLWTDWKAPGTSVPAKNRYAQWRAILKSNDPLNTPRLTRVTLTAKTRPTAAPAWAAALRVVAFHNEEIRYTSLPFEYEDPRNPRLVALRQKYKLDEVVAGATSETEQMVKLRDWVAHQWKYQPPEENYPAWDADEILTRKCGFCVQYAVVMMQCALSLGHQARFVFGHNPGAFDAGGHEVCEIWSNEHRKWIFYDVNENWLHVDPRTQTPLSMLDVHDLLTKTYYGGQPATLANAPQKALLSDAIATSYGTNLSPSLPPVEFQRHYADGRYTVPTRWLFMNYLPRNNFYAHAYPQPKTQGTHWDWSEYWCWEDAVTPKQWLYRNFTARRSDLNWTLNQTRFDATATERPNLLAIQMGTSTPYFDSYLVKLDQQPWRPSPRAFSWALHAGQNRLEMRVRNQAGVLGPVSFLEVEN